VCYILAVGFLEKVRSAALFVIPPSEKRMIAEFDKLGALDNPRKFIRQSLIQNGGCMERGELRELFNSQRYSIVGAMGFDAIAREGIQSGTLEGRWSGERRQICIADFSAPEQLPVTGPKTSPLTVPV
jgi:hypothetical protein